MKFVFPRTKKIPAAMRQDFYKALATIDRVGLPQYQALEDMAESFNGSRHQMGPVISELLDRLRGAGESKPGVGKRTLGTELAGVIPREESMLIQAGESSGMVAVGLDNAAHFVGSRNELKSTLFKLLAKPVMYLCGLMGMLIFFHYTVFPMIEVSHPRANWPQSAQIVGWVCDHAIVITLLIMALVFCAAGFLQYVLPRWVGEMREKFDQHFPCNLAAQVTGVTFLKSLAAYTQASTPIEVAISNIAKSGTPYMKWQCEKALALISHGNRLDKVLPRLAIIPSKYHWIIKVYSRSRDAAVAYNTMANSMTEHVQKALEYVLGWALGNFIFFVMAVSMMVVWSSFFSIASSK